MADRAQIDGWTGQPALADQKNIDDFRRLRREIDQEIAPANIFEKIEVRDISQKLAEEQRLKQMQTAIVESARVESLAILLTPTFGQNVEKARKTAQNYFSGNDETKGVAKKLVSSVGISMERIDANALHLRMTSIHALDAMIDRREVARNRIIKRHLKRKKASILENPAPATKKNDLETPKKRLHFTRKGRG